MSVTNLTVHSQVQHESFWHIFPNIEGKIRRHPTIDRIKRNLPMVESAADVVTRASQSKELSAFMQAFNNTGPSDNNGVLTNLEILKVIGKVRFVAGLIGMVAGAAKIASEISNITVESWKNRPRERNDAIVRLFEGVISLGDAISSFGKSFAMAGWANQAKVLQWALPLGYASALLSSITIYINWRAKTDSTELLHRVESSTVFNGVERSTDFKWLADEISDPKKDGDYFVQKHFEVNNREKYGAQIVYIATEGSDEAKNDLKDALKNRLSDKISGHNQAIVSTIISIFATVCLFFPVLGVPMLLTGLGLAVLAGTISIYKYVKDKRSIRAFEEAINKIQAFDNIPDSWIKANAPFANPCLNESEKAKPLVELPAIPVPTSILRTN